MSEINMTGQENTTTLSTEVKRFCEIDSDSVEDEKEIQYIKNNYKVFGLGSFIYSIIYVILLYRNPCSVTFPIFIAFTLAFCVFVLNKFDKQLNKKSFFYMSIIFLLGVSVCLTGNISIILFNKVGIILLLLFFMMEQMYDTRYWSVGRNMQKLLSRLCAIIQYSAKPWSHLYFFSKKHKKKTSEKSKYIFIGLGIAIPLAALVMGLLTHADVVFSDLFLGILRRISISMDTLYIMLTAAVVYTVIYSFSCSSMITKKTSESIGKKGQPVIAITFTSVLAVIYLIFCAIQIMYLFVGVGSNINYSEFARQGFFELLFVSGINLILVILCVELFEKSKILNIILTCISSCTYVLIASSAYRMILYVQVHNFTFLRIFVLWFLAVLTVWMTGAIFFIYKRRWNYFKFSVCIISVMYLALVYSNPDRTIAEYNVAHGTKIDIIDIQYLYDNLSAGDVLPELLKIKDEQMYEDQYDKMKENLKYYCKDILEKCEKTPLRETNFSYWKSQEAARRYLVPSLHK